MFPTISSSDQSNGFSFHCNQLSSQSDTLELPSIEPLRIAQPNESPSSSGSIFASSQSPEKSRPKLERQETLQPFSRSSKDMDPPTISEPAKGPPPNRGGASGVQKSEAPLDSSLVRRRSVPQSRTPQPQKATNFPQLTIDEKQSVKTSKTRPTTPSTQSCPTCSILRARINDLKVELQTRQQREDFLERQLNENEKLKSELQLQIRKSLELKMLAEIANSQGLTDGQNKMLVLERFMRRQISEKYEIEKQKMELETKLMETQKDLQREMISLQQRFSEQAKVIVALEHSREALLKEIQNMQKIS